MLYLIVASKKDRASLNIAQHIIEEYDFEATTKVFDGAPVYSKTEGTKNILLVITTQELSYAQNITDYCTPELVVFVSRHQSRSGKPTLSVHTPGNLDTTAVGGLPEVISISPANAMRWALQEMAFQRERLRLQKYSVSYEGTHHGPSLNVPAMFVEVGSTLHEWQDPKAATAVAHAAMAAITRSDRVHSALGIGGSHYNRKFSELGLTKDVAFGHMIPKYAVHLVDARLLKYCLERTSEDVEYVVLDWKGIRSQDKRTLTEALREVPVQIRRAKDF